MFDVFNPMAFQVHGGGDGHGGIAEVVGNFLAFIESLLSMPAAEIFPTLLPGIAKMGNLHPLFVHFPIVFLLAFFFVDIIASLTKKESGRTVAGWFLYVGTLAILVAVATGLYAAATVPHGGDVHDIMEHHEHLGVAVLVLGLMLCVWRWLGRRFLAGAANVLYLSMAAIMVLCMSLGADLGGLMVYQYGVNVAVMESSQAFDLDHSHEQHAEIPVDNMEMPAEFTPEPSHEHHDGHSHAHGHSHTHDHAHTH